MSDIHFLLNQNIFSGGENNMKTDEFLAKLAETLEWQEPSALSANTVLAEIWDSMGQINVITMLDEELDLTLEIDELENISTVQDIINIIASRNITLE
jgi:acyl carrier protein